MKNELHNLVNEMMNTAQVSPQYVADKIVLVINNEEKKCIVYGCENYKGEGAFIGDICYPCYQMITTGSDNPSTNFIHKLFKENKIKSQEDLETQFVLLHRNGVIDGIKALKEAGYLDDKSNNN